MRTRTKFAVATDGSAESDRALDHAVEMATATSRTGTSASSGALRKASSSGRRSQSPSSAEQSGRAVVPVDSAASLARARGEIPVFVV